MENMDAKQVCEDCAKETQIEYEKVNNFLGRNSMKDLGAANTGLMRNIFEVLVSGFIINTIS